MRRHISVVPSARREHGPDWLRTAAPQADGLSLLHVAADPEDLPRLASVITATAATDAFDQVVLDAGAGPGIESALAPLGVDVPVHHHLPGPPEVPEDVHALLDEYAPTAVVVHVDDQVGLCCAIAAAHRGISVVRIGGVPESGAGRVIARLADVLLTRTEADPLDAPIVLAPERVTAIGNPLLDVVQQHARAALDAAAWRRHGLAPGNYVLAVLSGHVPFPALQPVLTELAARNRLVLEGPARWEIPTAQRVGPTTFLERLSLERTAAAIVTDSPRVREEAAVLGVPCHAIDADGVVGAADEGSGPRIAGARDGRAGERAADALVANFTRLRFSA